MIEDAIFNYTGEKFGVDALSSSYVYRTQKVKQ